MSACLRSFNNETAESHLVIADSHFHLLLHRTHGPTSVFRQIILSTLFSAFATKNGRWTSNRHLHMISRALRQQNAQTHPWWIHARSRSELEDEQPLTTPIGTTFYQHTLAPTSPAAKHMAKALEKHLPWETGRPHATQKILARIPAPRLIRQPVHDRYNHRLQVKVECAMQNLVQAVKTSPSNLNTIAPFAPCTAEKANNWKKAPRRGRKCVLRCVCEGGGCDRQVQLLSHFISCIFFFLSFELEHRAQHNRFAMLWASVGFWSQPLCGRFG